MSTEAYRGGAEPRERAAFFRELIERAPYGAIVAEAHSGGRCWYANPEFTTITGYTLDDVPTVADWIERAYPDAEYQAYVLGNWERDTDPANMGRDVVYRVRCADGSDKYVQLRASPLSDGRMLVSLLDVSLRTGEERALEESEQRYRALVETVPLGIAVHSAGRIDYVNPFGMKLFGATAEDQILGDTVIRFVHPDSRAVVAQRMRSIYEKGGTAAMIEERLLRLDGTAFDADVIATMVDFAGRPASLVLFSDVTERRRIDAERRVLEEQIRHSQKMESLGILAGGVAHDFNNLLVAILGRAELARTDAPSDNPVHEHLVGIEAAARQAADLAHQMLAYAGQGSFTVAPIDLRETVLQTQRLLEATVSRRSALAFDLGEEPTVVEADATQIRQVLMNLVTNAVEALGDQHGTITVRTGRATCSARELRRLFAHDTVGPGPYAFLEVEDTGEGMDLATRQRMFEPFYSTKFTGRGLGLAAVLGIVRGHRGAIAVDSHRGSGTRIRVLLPLTSRRAVLPTAGPDDAAGWRATGTVLVVDDDPFVEEVARVMLTRMGLEVVSACDGVEALQRFGAAPDRFDLVLLDLTMPRLDGPETLVRLRGIRPDVCVLLSSGFGEEDVSRRLEGAQVAGFVAKPYTYDGLARAVREAMEKGR